MSDPVERPPREPILERLRRLGIKNGPAGGPPRRVFRTKRYRREHDENMFSKRPGPTTDTNK